MWLWWDVGRAILQDLGVSPGIVPAWDARFVGAGNGKSSLKKKKKRKPGFGVSPGIVPALGGGFVGAGNGKRSLSMQQKKKAKHDLIWGFSWDRTGLGRPLWENKN